MKKKTLEEQDEYESIKVDDGDDSGGGVEGPYGAGAGGA